MKERKCLNWDYPTFRAISETSKVNWVSLRRNVLQLAQELGIEFKGFRRELKK